MYYSKLQVYSTHRRDAGVLKWCGNYNITLIILNGIFLISDFLDLDRTSPIPTLKLISLDYADSVKNKYPNEYWNMKSDQNFKFTNI